MSLSGVALDQRFGRCLQQRIRFACLSKGANILTLCPGAADPFISTHTRRVWRESAIRYRAAGNLHFRVLLLL